jgi:hypothetical protein
MADGGDQDDQTSQRGLALSGFWKRMGERLAVKWAEQATLSLRPNG